MVYRCSLLLVLFGTVGIGCGVPAVPDTDDSTRQAQGVCTARVTCADGTARQCSGGSVCRNSADGCGAWVECDGVRTTCPTCPCEWNGVRYSSGSKYYGGSCTGTDPYTGEPTCVGGPCESNYCYNTSIYCRATCNNGQWQCPQ
jgi:hypothetical protein